MSKQHPTRRHATLRHVTSRGSQWRNDVKATKRKFTSFIVRITCWNLKILFIKLFVLLRLSTNILITPRMYIVCFVFPDWVFLLYICYITSAKKSNLSLLVLGVIEPSSYIGIFYFQNWGMLFKRRVGRDVSKYSWHSPCKVFVKHVKDIYDKIRFI